MTEASHAAVDVLTFGCRLNIVESEAMRQVAHAAGHRGLTIVNTCAVTAEAARQARQAIRRLKRDQPDRRIVVTGCASEIEPAGFRAMLEVADIVANRDKTTASTWAALAPAASGPVATRGLSPSAEATSHTRGFLEIQNGCDHRCTFCVIPFGRGASRSVPAEAVIARARRLVATGTREIVLTGVDITSYGQDLPERPKLGDLVRGLLAALPDLPRLRLSSIDCIEADPALLDVFATEPRFMPHLHLSLQSGSDLVLKRMKRRHGRAEAIAFCRTVRALRPEVVFGADIIAGFPTETDAMFEESVSLVAACGLTHLHVFPYSPRPGTPATRMPQVPRDLAKARAAALRAVADRALADHLDSQVGRRRRLLMERGGKGRTEDFTAVRVPDPPPAGSFADVLVTGHDGRELSGTLA